MNFIPLDDCQLDQESIDSVKEIFHRIFLALVFTGILYINVELNQPKIAQNTSPSAPSQLVTKPIVEVGWSNISIFWPQQ